MSNKITPELVDHLAHLSRLEFEQQAKEEIVADLNKMLGFVEKLNELNVDNIDPLIYMTDEVNILRADTNSTTLSKEDALQNAPQHDSDYFKVPKVIDKR